MYNFKMSQDEVYSYLLRELDYKEEEFEEFSEKLNKCLLENDDPSPEDLFSLGRYLENGGGPYDEVGISLVRLAALKGHAEAIEWYEYTREEKVA